MSQLIGRRVLVVEDEALLAMLVDAVLTQHCVTVAGPVDSVAVALRSIEVEGRALDAAVLDPRLMDGMAYPVADRLAALGVPFVFTTGDVEGVLDRYPGVPILSKPFSDADLITTLAGVMRRH